MTSHEVEDVHTKLLQDVFSAAGFTCVRPDTSVSEPSVKVEEEAEIESLREEGVESYHEDESYASFESLVAEEPPAIFPTPSLQYQYTSEYRKIQAHNRIHVLPHTFKTEIDPQMIPKISTTPPYKYIEIIAGLLGCSMYKSSLAEYWFLDTMANLLRRAQEEHMDKTAQAILMHWFCEWIREMQVFDAADRHRMMRRFKDTMLKAGEVIANLNILPTPAQAEVYYTSKEEFENTQEALPLPPRPSELGVHFEGALFACHLDDLIRIIHYIFDLFSTDYQYDLVRSIFCDTPEYILIDGPYQMQLPKRLYVPFKGKPQKPKKESTPKAPKGKKKEPDPEEYLALMAFKAKELQILAEQEIIEQEEWNRKNSILPLTFAVTDEFFDKYWPPPPPEPAPEPVADAKGKGKGKGKK